MFFDLEGLVYAVSYRLLVNTVVPRPVALVTTCDGQGLVYGAPFSFINLMGHDPPVLVLGIERRKPKGYKDTLNNMRDNAEFAVALVDEDLAEGMNQCGVDHAPEVDELARAGLLTVPARKIAVPLIAAAPVSLECTVRQIIELGEQRNIIIGDILALHLADHLWEPEGRYVRTEEMRLIARMHGRGWYVRTSDLFHLKRKEPKE